MMVLVFITFLVSLETLAEMYEQNKLEKVTIIFL